MELIHQISLVLHIAAGTLALITGLFAMSSKKGGNFHKRNGKIFYYSMIGVVVTSLILSVLIKSSFLFHIGGFTFFMNYFGNRVTKNKSLKASYFDWMVLIIAIANTGFMIFSFNLLLMIFGAISLGLSISQSKLFIFKLLGKKIDRMSWLRQHIGMMIGSYISTLTAFLVVNIQSELLGWTLWLLPTIVLTPLIVYWTRKYTMKIPLKVATAVILILFQFNTAYTQPYVEGGETRHRFAQMNIGLDVRNFFSKNSEKFILNGDDVFNSEMENLSESRLIVGGTHFWGHADFYLAFNLISSQESNYRNLIQTGARYFPYRIESGSFSPFAGISWQTSLYQQGEGVNKIIHNFPFSLGVVYAAGDHLLELSGGYNFNNSFKYFNSANNYETFKSQPYWVSIGYKYMFETTIGAENHWQSGRTKQVTDTLEKLGRLDGITIGAGIASSVFLSSSEYNQTEHPYIGNHEISTIFPEFAIGYYFHTPDIQVNLSYRNISSKLDAYDYSQGINRQAITLEAYKFLFDFHGFAPFIGPSISYEKLKFEEDFSVSKRNIEKTTFKPGLTFGWDIRPNRINSFYLRTNLRWFPNMGMNIDNKDIPFDQLEINFIELVIFPKRLF